MCDRLWTDCFLTLLVQEELVEPQSAGLFADEAVHVLSAMVVDGDGVFQRLHTRLQTERNLGVADGVPEKETHICATNLFFTFSLFFSYVLFHCKVLFKRTRYELRGSTSLSIQTKTKDGVWRCSEVAWDHSVYRSGGFYQELKCPQRSPHLQTNRPGD